MILLVEVDHDSRNSSNGSVDVLIQCLFTHDGSRSAITLLHSHQKILGLFVPEQKLYSMLYKWRAIHYLCYTTSLLNYHKPVSQCHFVVLEGQGNKTCGWNLKTAYKHQMPNRLSILLRCRLTETAKTAIWLSRLSTMTWDLELSRIPRTFQSLSLKVVRWM